MDGKRYQVPTDWGTEAIAFDTEQNPLEYGTASYGDLWKDGAQATVRGHSSLIGLGLWLEAEASCRGRCWMRSPIPMRRSRSST
ncbi:hypothetical protein FLP41_09870 [Paracoccus marcusii]|uniref:hypothetical protein n=1 Tax=Paracoccus marcusii TaxID=59779 RepID=UPI002ED48FBE|nr:hypothetical protein FLP41_09870 [Paracoccus marcusii]